MDMKKTNKNIFFLRHFETTLNKFHIIGQLDIDEFASTENHISSLELLPKIGELIILSSPLMRCIKTVDILKTQISAVKYQINVLDDLKERCFGDFEGERKQEVILKHPNFFKNGKFIKELTPPNGESHESLLKRIKRVEKHIEESPFHNIVICSHNHFMKLLLDELTQKKPVGSFDFINGMIVNIQNLPPII
jgi:alpha-ribazole phosphatase